jgi:hypothetical protein
MKKRKLRPNVAKIVKSTGLQTGTAPAKAANGQKWDRINQTSKRGVSSSRNKGAPKGRKAIHGSFS